MTREEEIRKASATTLLQINCDIQEAVISAFKDGAKWADKNPQSPWINVKDDLPNNEKYRSQPDYTPWVLAITIEGQICAAQMLIMHGKWVWQSHYAYPIDIEYWMPIPEPPKE